MAEEISSSSTVTPSTNLKNADAAIFLNVKPETLNQWRWNGRGPKFIKLNRSVRYRLADLEAFLEERVFTSTTEAGRAAA